MTFDKFENPQSAFAYFTDKLRSRLLAMERSIPKWQEKNNEGNPNEHFAMTLVDEKEELLRMTDGERKAAFQKQYKKEMARQALGNQLIYCLILSVLYS